MGILSDKRFKTTSACGKIDSVLAVKTDRPFQVAGSNEVDLVSLVGPVSRQIGIERPFGFVRTWALMGQVVPGQDPIDRPLGRQRSHMKILHLPENGLGPKEKIVFAIV